MQNIKLIILVLFCGVLHNTSVNAQTTDSTGSIKGKAKDSIYNFMLTSATVAVYKDADGALLQYTLPNNFGEFTVEKLPFNIPLKLVLTHVGYKDLVKQLSLSPTQKIKDLGTLFLYQNERDSSGNILEEVVVKSIPPMRMNGDTIEFNADAFNKMDKNATAEDLMRRLPGFTIWSDGEITYNGKKINAVLVGGKPFMGSTSASVATQNLPKDALDKIQVYQQRDEKNPLDSTMFANIKLKENKKLGYFGKLSTGMGSAPSSKGGSEERLKYAADGMLSGFNKKLQITTVGAFNNINKLANNTEELLKTASFKSEGTNINYQSDFELPGVNKHIAGGATMQYDFIPETAFMKLSRLKADYFYRQTKNTTENTTTTNWLLQQDTVLSRQSTGNNETRDNNQSLNIRWRKEAEKYVLELFTNADLSRQQQYNLNTEDQSKTGMGKIGYSSTLLNQDKNVKNFSAGFLFDYKDSWRSFETEKQRVSKKFTFNYQFDNKVSEGSSLKKSQFIDLLNPAANQRFDRMYEKESVKNFTHTISFKYPELKKLLLNKRTLGGVEIAVAIDMIWNKMEGAQLVKDKDSVTQLYLLNKNLSYQTIATTQNIMPAIHLEKVFYKGLTNRFSKSVSLQVQLKEQFYRKEFQSSWAFQNHHFQYQKFIPQALFSYYNHQYGTSESRYRLGFATELMYPDIQQIAPLVDSSIIWMIYKGNKNLQPQYKKALSASYNFTTRRPKNPLIIDITIDLGKWENYIADSILYNSAGVRTVYPVNMQGNIFVNNGIQIQKMIALNKHHTLELGTDYKMYHSKIPQYLNTALVMNKSVSHNPGFHIWYRYKDLGALKIEEGWWLYKSSQTKNDKAAFTSKNQFTKLIAVVQWPKNLVWNTQISYHKNTGSYTDALYYTLWNAGISYRFLKGNRAEVKMEVLDLLKQNKGVVNTSTANVQTFAVTNVLQNYYLLTLSYFPRKFGK
ncbi:MAG: hypothetical protein E6Q95_06055 [Chitinophagaceae bacterium]|nr:MAG: hypothetical protein E6Q95_06055 [Chitinophagaceae bacterium]